MSGKLPTNGDLLHALCAVLTAVAETQDLLAPPKFHEHNPKGRSAEPQQVSKSIRVAIVCGNASYKMGGEAAIPLRFFKYLLELGHRPLLLTHERVKSELEEILSLQELNRVIFFEDSRLQIVMFRLTKSWPSAIKESFVYPAIHLVTEQSQKYSLRLLARQGKLDIAFMPTPISPLAISLIDKVGVPTVFGPLNGAMNYPPAFKPRSGRIAETTVSLGRLLAQALHWVFPAKRHASSLLVSNERTLDGLPKATRKCAILRSYDATIEANRWSQIVHDPAQQATHFLCVGRLVDWKAVEYCVLATQRVAGARLIVVGDGPERKRLEALAAQGNAEIQFTGHMRHDQLLKIYPSVIAQVLPSLREAGGNVCLEALAAGVPVIATKWGGSTDTVVDGIEGYLVEPTSEEALIEGIANAMRHLQANTALARAMGAAGRKRVLDAFDWRAKAEDVARIFEACLAGELKGVLEAHPSHTAGNGKPHVNLAWRSSVPVQSAFTTEEVLKGPTALQPKPENLSLVATRPGVSETA